MRPIRFMATGWDTRQSKDCDNTHPINRVLIPSSGGAEWSHRRADRAVPSDSHRHRGAHRASVTLAVFPCPYPASRAVHLSAPSPSDGSDDGTYRDRGPHGRNGLDWRARGPDA
ncbi:hypothetical protein MUK42_36639 [Musa troglodytarum]|uniref:Uncharacterized protein n=1 Tax=Musa troglodytarum TaxID=320322 RepID=A0A9E7FQD2_9LILI|nr:hypothetical protein MUK42_36639 [Musa troglodytarum]